MIASKLTGKMIRTLRERLSWSQKELSEHLGISEGSVRNYEKESRVDKDEPVIIPLLLDWALAAIDAGLRPLSEKLFRKGK